jgi:checkpoint serine/threonine-protein kinase
MDYSDQGTLQDVINAFRVKGNKMDETLIMYYAIEMLSIAESMHNSGIIHGDIKPDNFLIFGTDE